jgi:Uncharacterized protein conserved in bacteria (DUF2252)
MSFRHVNSSFEEWLRERCAVSGCVVVEADLKKKHRNMKKDPFIFLRATFFRWAGRIETLFPDLAGAPAVLSLGDAHIENFGTWRDNEGRLVWGVNDFDEAAVTAYPFDLVRLATSTRLAPGRMIGGQKTCAAILRGYDDGLAHPRPGVLDEHDLWLRPLVNCPDDKRAKFWRGIDALDAVEPPTAVRAALLCSLPSGAANIRFARRTAGEGSLGRPRFVAIADWRGGRVLREAKALVPSAWDWAHGSPSSLSRFADLATVATRAPDPYMNVAGTFVVRRLAPDSRKAELGDEAGAELREGLLEAMGREIGSLQAATADVPAVRRDLRKRGPDWLHAASKVAAAATERDFDAWRVRGN